MKMSVNTFIQCVVWRDRREKQGNPVPKDLIECNNKEMLNWCLLLFVKEIRRVDRKLFPSRTIDMLLSGLKHYRLKKNPVSINILSERSHICWSLRNSRYCCLTASRSKCCQAYLSFHQRRSMLWCKGILGITSPKALLCAVFFANGKHLCL